MAITIEDVLDKISNKLIEKINGISDELGYNVVKASQKVIRGGQITAAGETGIQPGERLVLFDQDTLANSEDDLQALENDLEAQYGESWYNKLIDDIDIEVTDTAGNDSFGGWQIWLKDAIITDIIVNLSEENFNPLNVGQFIDFDETTVTIDPAQAQEFLDTNIFELLPAGLSRQDRINKFFQEYEILKGNVPPFDEDPVDGNVDETFDSEAYSEGHDISAAQDSGVSEEDSSITRLNTDANAQNKSKTLQHLRDDLNNFLKDVDQTFESALEDGRPEYESKSDGFLKIRNLNQGIIIRKQEGDDIGIEKEVINTSHVNSNHICTVSPGGPSYLCNGFTVSIWVRFLDRTSKGTLFNYGNPLRSIDPKGFKLETFVLNKDEKPTAGTTTYTWGELVPSYFVDNDFARFIRLIVRDHTDNNNIYDSHLGMPGLPRTMETNFVPEFGQSLTDNYVMGDESYLITHTNIPIDFNEWFFIVATYNPLINDAVSGPDGYATNPEYWNGNVAANGSYVHYSGLGSKCKVEVISKSQLLLARGYKV